MNDWTAQSNPSKQTWMVAMLTAMSLVLLYACRHFSNINTKAGFLLGLLLLVLGAWGLLTRSTQTIVIDAQKRRITVTDKSRTGSSERVIRFDDITHVGMGYLGKRSNFVQWHYLSLLLRSGERYPLFAPGRFYEGSSDERTVQGWRDRLETMLRA
ncbi:MAG: hypothetical protein AUJ20_05365 [Comamonadaceae bacterium CG1_02_60_18]|nr:MAG: hypothetical protein AUJ20_05365 [Comamonadaceae bacterium CG1_02_60_18]PIQ53765.1 MAG: hypothetical protein COW02_07115 [Comamonadaceae bacterium CG12_big_fil_rev_8_21_14_0_65_59_15]